MFRKQLILIGFLLVSLVSVAQNNPFYYEHIFNEDKTINFVFAFYPLSYQHFELTEQDSCTTFKSIIINKTIGSLAWDNYKVRIRLKDGRVVNSMVAGAKEGRMATSYSIPASENHTQFFCFPALFADSDVDKLWLVMDNDKTFELELYKDKDKGDK